MTNNRDPGLNAAESLRFHWPEYGMEFVEMGVYLFSTCTFATLLQHPASPLRQYLANGLVRRACFGLSIGATIAALVLTPWGKQSGGHLNPAITFAFYRLGKVQFWDAIFYGVAQYAGATVGVVLATLLLLGAPAHPTIRYAATLPGRYGLGTAFFAEVAISCALMLTVLYATNHESLSRYTPYFVGALYVIFITLETPLSGMSMNPARTFGSAFRGRYWHALWIYFFAPTIGMLLAAEIFLRGRGGVGPYCAKLTTPMTSAAFFATTQGPLNPNKQIFKSKRYTHEKMDENRDPSRRGGDPRCLVCVPARAPRRQSPG